MDEPTKTEWRVVTNLGGHTKPFYAEFNTEKEADRYVELERRDFGVDRAKVQIRRVTEWKDKESS